MPLYSLDGREVRLPASGRCYVAPSATVLGNVILEEDTSIWFGAVLRGDTEPIRVGARSNVQDGCVFHTDPGYPLEIGEDCTIGHMAMLHGCVIGKGSLIGIGATILNGARIGENSLIGAGALIPEGKSIPARSVVMGAPGKIVREVTEPDIARMREGTEAYVRRWKQFAAGLRG